MDKVDYGNDINWLRKGIISRKKEDETNEINEREINVNLKKSVDTFYVYPSGYKSSNLKYEPLCKIDDPKMRKIANLCYIHQGSAFEKHTNVFAPYYRQMDPKYGLKLVKWKKHQFIEKYWAKDIVDSFKYYVENLNGGKPFILAGHSQGSRMLMILLSTYLKDNPHIYKKMIAAYIVGETVDENYLKINRHLKFAEGEDDVGVIISWNTEMANMQEENPVIFEKTLVINPLNWKRDESYGDKSMNLGGKLKSGEIVEGKFDGKINLLRSSLQCSTANQEEYTSQMKIFPFGCYHEMDYNFYYKNIEHNVGVRIKSYFKNMSQT